MKIAIIVNSNVQAKARPCFWKCAYWREIFDTAGHSIEYISIADDIANSRIPPVTLFRVDTSGRKRYDLIIVSWDALNGDPVFLSDVGLTFFLHYSPSLDRWVRKGGVIIVEFQSAAFRLVQKAYSVFTHDDGVGRHIHTIEVSQHTHNASKAYLRRNTDHPLMQGISRVCIEERVSAGGFGEGEIDTVMAQEVGGSFYNLSSVLESLAKGWFFRAHKSWLPLLWADKRRREPIIIVRHVLADGNAGAYIITAMLLSNPRFHQGKVIIDNATKLQATLSSYVEKHRKRHIVRMIMVSTSVVVGVMVAVFVQRAGFEAVKYLFSGFLSGLIIYLLGRYLPRN